MMDIAGIRKEYQLQTLDSKDVAKDPLAQFISWFSAAIEAKVNEPNAMVLSTIRQNRRPSARVVLLKGVNETGLTFFTNYESEKGQQLVENPFASLTFFWPELERQVRLEGKVDKLSESESLDYFLSRPRGSQLGAHASHQSTIVPDREYLESSFQSAVNQYEGKEVPKPSYWGGYVFIPDYVEFWQGRPSRLHDRIVYKKDGGNWILSRLAP